MKMKLYKKCDWGGFGGVRTANLQRRVALAATDISCSCFQNIALPPIKYGNMNLSDYKDTAPVPIGNNLFMFTQREMNFRERGYIVEICSFAIFKIHTL